MIRLRQITIALALFVALALPVTGIFAQEATETPIPEATDMAVPPAAFTDGRISDIVGLGGLALYCVDASGNTNVTTFEDGAITVWGVGDQKYIELTADELRGSVEVSQEPSVMEMEGDLTEAAPMDDDSGDTAVNEDASMDDDSAMAEATPMVMMQEPVLLARATTPNGEIGFFSLGDDQFVLQGYDDKGKFFTYAWTGCSTGTVEHVTAPFLPFLERMPDMESTDEMDGMSDMGDMATPEATDAA